MGSFSRIEKTTGDKASYELYGSGDLHFGRLLHNRRFDIAMVAFLDCLKHLMDHIKSQDSGVDFPHQFVLRFVELAAVTNCSCQSDQGQDRRCIRQTAVQSRGSVDKIFTTCSFGPEDMFEMGNERREWLTS